MHRLLNAYRMVLLRHSVMAFLGICALLAGAFYIGTQVSNAEPRIDVTEQAEANTNYANDLENSKLVDLVKFRIVSHPDMQGDRKNSLSPIVLRSKVPGGWFVMTGGSSDFSTFFYPDQNHTWLPDLDKKE